MDKEKLVKDIISALSEVTGSRPEEFESQSEVSFSMFVPVIIRMNRKSGFSFDPNFCLTVEQFAQVLIESAS